MYAQLGIVNSLQSHQRLTFRTLKTELLYITLPSKHVKHVKKIEMLTFPKAAAISNVPIVSMLAAIIGIP